MKPQDIVVALKLCLPEIPKGYAALAKSLGMSASGVHSAIRRLVEARLADPETQTIHRELFRNFLVHGAAHAFPAKIGAITRGVPTAWAAPVMLGSVVSDEQTQPVWPDADGSFKGASVKPLYKSAAKAARLDSRLYDLLALVDALRLGRARERKFAEEMLANRLKLHG